MAIPEPHNSYQAYAQSSFLDFWPELREKMHQIYFIGWPAINDISVDILKNEIVEQVNDGKCYIVFDNSAEAVFIPIIEKMDQIVEYFENEPVYFYYWTSSITGQEDCNKISTTGKIKALSCSVFERSARHQSESINRDYTYTPGIREKLFLCYNRVERHHRIDLLQHMIRLDLVKDSFYSFAFTESETIATIKTNPAFEVDLLLNNLDMLPLTINRSPTETNPVKLETDDFKHFDNSYISLVTETLFYDPLNPIKPLVHAPSSVSGVFFSEKIFKPIVMSHPFIAVSTCGFLQGLRSIGYKTFHPFIDETYDTIENDSERMLAIVNEVERLSKFTDQEWIDFTHNIKDIIEYNALHIRNKKDFSITKNAINLFN